MTNKEKLIETLHSHSYNVEDQAGNHLIVVDDDSFASVADEIIKQNNDKMAVETFDKQDFFLPNIQMIILHAGNIDLTALEKLKEKLQSDFTRYEALGIVDGHSYYKKLDTRKALLQRMKAIYNLAKVVHETKDLIEAIKPKE